MSGSAGSGAGQEPLGLPAGSPVRVLSDLHLGHDQSVVDRVAALRPLIAGGGVVVFNGDTTEARALRFRERSAEMTAALLDLCREEGVTPVMINGNHDPEHWPHDAVEGGDGRVFITHGHVLLRLVSPWSAKLRECRGEIEALLAAAGDMAELPLPDRFALTRAVCLAMPPSETRQEGRSLRAVASLFLREIWPPRRPWEVLKVWAQLPGLADGFMERHRPDARAMVFGHTHRPAVWRRGGRWLVNTGGFVTFSRPLVVTADATSLRLQRVERRGSEFRAVPWRTLPLA